MPTLPLSSALLVFGNDKSHPWNFTAWQMLTNIVGPPWETPSDATPSSPAPNYKAWTVAEARSVEVYAQNLWSKSMVERHLYSKRGLSDNDVAGKKLWNDFVDRGLRKWRVNKVVDGIIKDNKLSPHEVLARHETTTLPNLETAQVFAKIGTSLADTLFGDDAFLKDGLFLRDSVKTFCDTLIVHTWSRYRKGLVREEELINKNRSELENAWAALNEEGSKTTIKTLRMCLELMRKQLTLLQRFEDEASLEQVENMERRLKALLAETQNDDSNSELRSTLPKVLRDALKKLASPEDVRAIEHMINAALEHVNTNENAGVVELPEGREVDIGWKEGVEDLANLSEEELWNALGFEDKTLPFFQTFTDPDAAIDPWTEDGERWLADPNSPREPLRPRWHQLVGIFRMLQRAFNRSPVLLMDGVGIGKTFQVIGFMTSLTYYRHYYARAGKFPGYFADKKWQGKDGNLPSNPFMIICPVSLHNQWMRELERFIQRHSFDILPYTGKFSTRINWWETIFKRSAQDPHHRIVLATESAIQDDSSRVLVDLIRTVDGQADYSAASNSRVMNTAYGREYLSLIIDEAHVARKFNKVHTAYHALRQKSLTLVAMTATPVMTKLQDLWIMGSMMGLPKFASQGQFKEMTTELNRAQTKDRKAERESETAGERLHALLSGEDVEQIASNSEIAPRMRQWIPWIRDGFQPYVIRRTLDSVDHTGNKIFGLPPYEEHVLLLDLCDWEKEQLRIITDEIIDQGPLTTLASAGKNFYIEFRRGLLHPYMNPRGSDGWVTPTSLEDWKENHKSTKLDILDKIVAHHLARDNAPALKVQDDGQSLQVVAQEPSGDAARMRDPDRVIIFSLFPSSNAAIREVLNLHNIRALELNGRTPQSKRRTILEEFRSSTHDAGSRVLILSMVGTVGLNLACANVMVIADTLWSALDDEQLRGRIYRFPQQKAVHFYRLVACGTPDVFLNNIAFDKGMLHQAFVGIDSHSLQLFSGTESDDATKSVDSDVEENGMDVDIEPEPETRIRRGTKKVCAREVRGPTLSPTRPSAKRAHSPTSPTKSSFPKPKKLKAEDKGKQKQSAEPIAGLSSSTRTTIATANQTSTSAVTPLVASIQTASALSVSAPTAAQVSAHCPNNNVIMDPPAEEDPLLAAMENDPDWEMDPDELDELAVINLTDVPPIPPANASSPLRELRSPSPVFSVTISVGVKIRSNHPHTSPTMASASTCPDPEMESVGGVSLVPGRKGNFKRRGGGVRKPKIGKKK